MLCALELVAGRDVELVEIGRAEVGQGMTLEPCPQEFHGFRLISIHGLHKSYGAHKVVDADRELTHL